MIAKIKKADSNDIKLRFHPSFHLLSSTLLPSFRSF